MTGSSRDLACLAMLAGLLTLALPIQRAHSQDAMGADRSARDTQGEHQGQDQGVTQGQSQGQGAQASRLRSTLIDEIDAYVMSDSPLPQDGEEPSELNDDPSGSFDPDRLAAPTRQDPNAPLQDGDLAIEPDAISTEGPRSSIDGPVAVQGEVTDLSRDTRPAEDLAVFEEPRAGYDARLFQVEDITPVTDRRPREFARLEPYDPVGFRIGSFVLFPEANFSQTMTDNVTSSNRPESDSFQTIRTETRLVSNWRQHALELRGTTDTSFHDTYDSEDVRGYLGEVRGRLDFSSRTNLQVIASTGVSQERRTGIDANRTGENADITTEQIAASLSHRFNRLTVRLRSSIMDQSFGTTDGISNAQRNYKETAVGLRGSYEVTGRVAVFGDVAALERDHVTTDVNRDTPGNRYRVGLDFGTTNKMLRGEVSVGYGTQRARDSRLEDGAAFLFDANLAWRPTGLTTFLFTAVSDIADTAAGSIAGVTSRQLGIEARHAFRNYLVASAGLTYTNFDYGSSQGGENGLTTFLGAEYTLNPEVMLNARVEHTTFDGSSAERTFDESNLRLGMRLRR